MSKSKEPSEAEIVFNKASIALAKHQQLVASWLPARTSEELANAKSQEEIDREEEEMFAPVPELLGVGASVKDLKNGLPQPSETSALDKLRKQLLGKKLAASASAKKPALPQAKVSVPTRSKVEDDSDEEDGRAAALTSKAAKAKRSHNKRVMAEQGVWEDKDKNKERQDQIESESDVESPAPAISTQSISEKPKKRANNYLDELLEQRSKKKKKGKS